MTGFLRRATALAMAVVLAGVAEAQVPPHGDTVVDTRHAVVIHGRRMSYTAHAGLLPLYVNDTGERMGSIFFIGYLADRPAGAAKRPITFLWNGGPGSNSAQVNVVGFGPKRVTTADTFPRWADNTETPIVDHDESWFETSDLVFIDPPGTGFSRATSKASRDILYTGRGDAEAVAEAIRIFLTRYDAWDRPLFIAGESYGTTRAMLVAEALAKRRTRLNGVVLISGNYDTGQKTSPVLTGALAITLYTVTGHYHHRLPADLQAVSADEASHQAEAWARTTYAPALARAEGLTDAERDAIVAGLSRYTGLVPRYIDRKTLTIVPDVYDDKLLADRGLELGRYDRRMTTPARPAGTVWVPWNDPSLLPMRDLMEGTSHVFNSYVRQDLGFQSDLLYRGPFGKAFHPEPLAVDPQTGFASDWMARMFNFTDRDPKAPAPLRVAMDLEPRLSVMDLIGEYDASCAARGEAVAQSEPSIRSRVTSHCVTGGHMFYSDRATRRDVQRYFADFVRTASAK